MEHSIFSGQIAHIFGDYFDIDMICGTKYSAESDPEKLLPVAMQAFDAQFTSRISPGDILVGGKEFAYGHPHAQGMIVMRHLGINTIIAKSFARGFFKNEISRGMVLLPCAQLPDDLVQDEILSVDLQRWLITRELTNEIININPISDVERNIMLCGGLANYLKTVAKGTYKS